MRLESGDMDPSLNSNLTSISSFQVEGINQDDLVPIDIFKGSFLLQKSWLFFKLNFSILGSMDIFSVCVSSQWKNSKFYIFISMTKKAIFKIICMRNPYLQISAAAFIFVLANVHIGWILIPKKISRNFKNVGKLL